MTMPDLSQAPFDHALAAVMRHLQEWPVKVESIARDLGIPVVFDTTMTPDVAGKIVRENRGTPSGYVIYINANDGPRRRRFTLAHEIAHYVLHRDLIGDGLIDDGIYRSKLGEMLERQASRLAADLLMPEGLVRALYAGGKQSLSDLAEAFDVSEQAIRIRLEELELIYAGANQRSDALPPRP
jgi:Zn-dependent peptidase ImmA (M78 family)